MVVALVIALVVALVVGRLLAVSRLVGRARGLGRRGHVRVLLPLEVVGDSAAEAQEGEGAEDRRDDRAWLGLGLRLGLRVGLGVCLRVCSRVGLGLRGGLGFRVRGRDVTRCDVRAVRLGQQRLTALARVVAVLRLG